MGNNMISLPLPLFTSMLCLLLAPLLWRLDLGRRASGVFFAVLSLCFALQAFLVGLRFGYGIDDFIVFQRLLPLAVGPLMYLGFLGLAVPQDLFHRRVWQHLGIAATLTIVLSVMGSVFLDFDLIIGLSYLTYCTLLIRLARKGPDALIQARLGLGKPVIQWMTAGAAFLGVLLMLDTVIALNFALAGGAQVSRIVSFGSAVFIVVLLIILARQPRRTPRTKTAQTSPTQTEDAQIETQAREMLSRTQLYLDPDLTVQRLARRLSIPERALSAAINQSQGMNVSQYVNGFRLDHAARLLRDTDDSVSKITLQSGFLTRSNFYREFQRVYGMSPARYRETAEHQT